MPSVWVLLLLLLWSPSVPGLSAGGLDGYVRWHKMLHYSPVSTGRGRRSAGLQLSLPTGGRVLSLRLVPDTITLAPDLSYSGPFGEAVGVNSVAPLYTGWVRGQPGSRIYGGLIDGVFDGTIVLPNETLVVERASLHVAGGPHGHSFVYRASDMILPQRSDGDRPCGVRDGPDPPTELRGTIETATTRSKREPHTLVDGEPRHDETTFEPTLQRLRDASRSRAKRQDDNGDASRTFGKRRDEIDEKRRDRKRPRTLCSMYMETDPVLWKHVFEREGGSLRRTEKVLQRLALSHMQAANRVYSNVSFDGQQQHRDFQFQIQKLVVSDDHTCLPNFSGRRNRLCFEHVLSGAYLNAHGNKNFDAFCLAFAMTYHDFEKGIMGLAWIGKPGTASGVCARNIIHTFSNPETGVFERHSRSTNTGMVSLFNSGRPVHPLQSQLTLAHEIGHTMGSPHDGGALGSPCLPNDADGNFIMFFLSQEGNLPRHHKFSNCSVGNISRVLDYVVKSKHNCFVEKNSSFCGNRIVESGEQCDCGFNVHDCQDRCCWPRYPHKNVRCRYRPGAACSPSQGPCCDPATCSTVPASANRTCRPATECTLPAQCDGRSLACPQSPRLADLTPCGEGSRVCQAGRCTGSACLSVGLLPCQLTEADTDGDRSLLCHVGCKPHHAMPCRLRPDWRLEAGDPCDEQRGVCDALLRCRPLEAEGPLERLEALLLAGGGAARMIGDVASRWWFTALLAVLLAAVCALLLRCIALHIPSSNPTKPASRSMSQTLRVPLSTFFGLSGGGDLQL